MRLSVAAPAFASLASAISVSYDPGYDKPDRSLNSVSCSGLITKYGWQTQGAVTRFPYIGGYLGTEWNSSQCGTCYSLTYNGRTIYILAVDNTQIGFNIAEAAMNSLTNNQAAQLGRIDAQHVPVDASLCGL